MSRGVPRTHIWRIQIGFWPKFMGLRPRLGNHGFTIGFRTLFTQSLLA